MILTCSPDGPIVSDSEHEAITSRRSSDRGWLIQVGSSESSIPMPGEDAEGPAPSPGQFFRVMYDATSRRYLAQIDSGGAAQLFFCNSGQLMFSDNAKSLIKNCGHSHPENTAWMPFLLTYGFIPSPYTLWEGVYAVPIGPSRVIPTRAGLSGTDWLVSPSVSSPVAKQVVSRDKAKDELYEIFMETLDLQRGGSKEVAVLVGGFDSALVAAGLSRLGAKVRTYSYRFDQERYTQPFVDDLADLIDGEHTWLNYSRNDYEQDLLAYGEYASSPTVWPSYILQTVKLGRLIRADGFESVFSGDGCDALFFGYPLTQKRGELVSLAAKAPRFILRAARSVVETDVALQNLGRVSHSASSILRNADGPENLRGFLGFEVIAPFAHSRFFDYPMDQNLESLRMLFGAHLGSKSVSYRSFFSKQLMGTNRLKISSMFADSGLSLKSPYMSAQLKHFVHALPEDFLRGKDSSRGNIGKEILADMAFDSGLLPAEIIWQPKLAAADFPQEEWNREGLKEKISELIISIPGFKPDALDLLLESTPIEKWFSKTMSRQTGGIVSTQLAAGLLSSIGALLKE